MVWYWYHHNTVRTNHIRTHQHQHSPAAPVNTMSSSYPFDEAREDEIEFDRLFPSITIARSRSEVSTRKPQGDDNTVHPDTPLHWYECERKNRDGTVLPRVPSVVPTTTFQCASTSCRCCRSVSADTPVHFVRTTRSLPLPRLKRQWWKDTGDNEGYYYHSPQRPTKRQRTTVHKQVDRTTPFQWALELQGWIDATLNPLLDAFDKRDDTL